MPDNNYHGLKVVRFIQQSQTSSQVVHAKTYIMGSFKPPSKPNYVIIVADDLGFSDVSCYGSEIQTPHIDSLAVAGTRFTDFHSAAACSPTRAMLLTGTDHHLTGLGQMAEFLIDSPIHQGKPGHEGYLNERVATLPEVLRADGGYHTMMAGKWHLGFKSEHSPANRGFDHSFALLPPAANHYAWEPEIQTGDFLCRFAEVNVSAVHMKDGQYVNNNILPADFYSSNYYTTELLRYMDERPRDRPFFAFLPFSAPHWPLQAPRKNIEKYRGMYDDGPDALRLRRIAALQRLELVPEGVNPHPVQAPEVPEWEEMTLHQRSKSARAMETYAGMVDCMDENIGRVIDYLHENGLYENTEIIFMSDNGAEGYSYEAHPLMGRKVLDYVGRYYNNSLDNIGNKDSFAWYGGRWAQAATAPSRLYKKFSTEGGIRVPFILKPSMDVSYRQSICHEFCTVMDVMPTMLEQAGIAKPVGMFGGRKVEKIMGTSWVPFLTKEAATPHPEDYVAGWELFGQAALRKGPWKLNFVNKPFGPEEWQLYNVLEDPGEVHDLKEKRNDKLEELMAHWHGYARETGVVGLKPEFASLMAQLPDEMENPVNWMKFETSRSVMTRITKGYTS